MSSSRVGPVGSHPSSSCVAVDDADISAPKNPPMNPKCAAASAGSTLVTGSPSASPIAAAMSRVQHHS